MPKFLLEVYERSLQEDGGPDHPEQGQNGGRHTRSTSDGNDQLITALDKEVIEQSDIIMTFLNKSESSLPESPQEFFSRFSHSLLLLLLLLMMQWSAFVRFALEDSLG